MGNRGKASNKRQLVELHAAVLRALPDMDPDVAQGWINNHRSLAKVLREALLPPAKAGNPRDLKEALAEWQRFYKKVFGRDIDVAKLKIPAARGDINFPLVITEDLARIVAKCRERFKTKGVDGYWQWTDKDLGKIVKSDRTANEGPYVVLVRPGVEADQVHRNKSAEDLKREGVIGITLEERLTYELFYHWETGEHLDQETWTLCSGSRDDCGGVPHVRFDGRTVEVYYYDPVRYFDVLLGAREAVS